MIISDPVVAYRETVTVESSMPGLSKSPNKHNRLYFVASPMSEELTQAIVDEKILHSDDPKLRARKLADEYEWDVAEARKIWCFGPDIKGPNVMVDVTKGVQFVNEIKDSCVAAFQWATKEGPLCEEEMRGLRFNLIDVTLHADAIHRGGGQILPPARRSCYAAMLLAKPTLQEPIFMVEVQVPDDCLGGIYKVLALKRGQVISEEQRPGTPMFTVKGYLPIAESFGFINELRAATGGQAFATLSMDHWEAVQGDATEAGSRVQQLCLDIRKRKGIKAEVPPYTEYYDKL